MSKKKISLNAKNHQINASEPSMRYKDVVTTRTPGKLTLLQKNEDGITLFANNDIILKIQLLNPSIIRFRYGIEGELAPDFSYAIDPKFETKNVEFTLVEKKKKLLLQTAQLTICILKNGFQTSILNKKGKVICEDAAGFSLKNTLLKGVTQLKLTKKTRKGEHFFGLGDKACSLDLRGKKFENWNTDSFAYGAESDPLYKTIPFYYSLQKGIGYGIFFDNTYRSRFDFGKTKKQQVIFGADGGEMNYYFIYGPQLSQVAEQYAHLTGKPELPPLWALGYHQCRWSYFPENQVKAIADGFRKLQIPCDAIYLDIDYMDGYRCFTWNKKHFPDPKKMIADLKAEGFKTIVMIDPGIKVDKQYAVYQSGRKANVFCRRPDGDLLKAPVWPAACVFPDFTAPKVRAWWGGLYKGLMKEVGVSGIWNDMNEPAVFEVNRKTFPSNIRHDHDGQPCSHKKAHNIYGLQMTRASYDGMKKQQPEKRPFLLTRATYSGGQRYASVWTGDNVASWEHIDIANRQSQRLSISGFSFTGSDIGGFIDIPDGELYVRWLQAGIFHPFCRTHSMGNNVDGGASVNPDKVEEIAKTFNTEQEPWSFGQKYTDIARQTIELRYRLLPYLYTAFWKNCTQGTPILQPLSFYDQNDAIACKTEHSFMVGDSLLVAPVTKPDKRKQKVYLPKGEWYNYWTDDFYKGGKTHKVKAPLAQVPIFIKAGAIVPHFPVMQYVGEKAIEELTLHIFFKKGKTTSILYEDAGEGYGYENGDFILKTFTLTGTPDSLKIEQTAEGEFLPDYLQYKIVLHGLPFEAQTMIVDGEVNGNIEDKGLGVEVKGDFQEIVIQ